MGISSMLWFVSPYVYAYITIDTQMEKDYKNKNSCLFDLISSLGIMYKIIYTLHLYNKHKKGKN